MMRTSNGRRRAMFAMLALAAGITPLVATPRVAAAAATILVDDDRAQCSQASFTSIQAAVEAAPPGARITVCDGTYVEQVTIPVGKDRVTIESKRRRGAVIEAPAAMVGARAIVHVSGATGVTVRDFTIAGPGSGTCDGLLAGVLVDGGGTAGILRNHIIDIRTETGDDCQNGNAVQIGGAAGSSGGASVQENVIGGYRKTGIVVIGRGSVASVERNVVTGSGTTATAAQNGIQVGDGASASVSRNTVTNNLYAPQDLASTGILLVGTAGADLDRNIVDGNDVGVYVEGAAGNVSLRANRVSFSTYDGIALLDSTGVTVVDNRSTDNSSEGTWLGAGIGVYGTTMSVFDRNVLERNRGSGLYFDVNTAGNAIGRQLFKDNVPFDCEDASAGAGTSGTANIWSAKWGTTENVPGLCTSARLPVDGPVTARLPTIAPPAPARTPPPPPG